MFQNVKRCSPEDENVLLAKNNCCFHLKQIVLEEKKAFKKNLSIFSVV